MPINATLSKANVRGDILDFKGLLRDPSPAEPARGRALRLRQGAPGGE